VSIDAIGLFDVARCRGIVVVNSEVRMNAAIRRLWVNLMDSRGAGMVEYALLVAFIAIALITAVTAVGTGLMSSFTGSAEAVDGIIT
jgi:Flp pilus assembly pilin Flp